MHPAAAERRNVTQGGRCAGAELEKLRLEYHDEIEAMRVLCQRVEESQERVRIETEQLHQNQQAAKLQENKILISSEQIEQKQSEFQAKGALFSPNHCPLRTDSCCATCVVLAVLEESKRVVALCDKKRDIHESS